MEENFNKQMEKLRISEGEKEHVIGIEDEDLEEHDKEIGETAVCKILTEKKINAESFRTMMPKIWNLEGEVTIKKVGTNLFECTFRSKKGRMKVLEGGPWSFDRGLLIFEDIKGHERYATINFRYPSFWIHFINLPRICFSRKWATVLGNSVGIFERVDVDEHGKCVGETLRVRVKIDIQNPLKRAVKIKVGTMGEEEWF